MPTPNPEYMPSAYPARDELIDENSGFVVSEIRADPKYAAANVVTLLTATGKRLTKSITPKGVQPADTPWRFTHDAEPVDNLEDMFELLRWSSTNTDTYIVRPAVINGAPPTIRRLSGSCPEQSLIDVPRNWIMVDIDKDILQFPCTWRRNPERHIRALISVALPHAFQGAGVIAQFSSQMQPEGGTPRVHLWFWLDRPLISLAAKRWLEGCPIDDAVYNRGQPHFTAAPIFEHGVDPLGDSRLIFLPGSVVTVPDNINTSALNGDDVALHVDISRFINLDFGNLRWRREIPKIGDTKGFHVGINDAAMAYITCTYNPQAEAPLASIDYIEFERAVMEHVSTLKLTPERRIDLDNRLHEMHRCFWGALPRVQQEIRKFGLPALPAPKLAVKGSLADMMARVKVRSRHND